MGVFSPGERETFERIAVALEDIAFAENRMADKLDPPFQSLDGKYEVVKVPFSVAAHLKRGDKFQGGTVGDITVRSKYAEVVVGL